MTSATRIGTAFADPRRASISGSLDWPAPGGVDGVGGGRGRVLGRCTGAGEGDGGRAGAGRVTMIGGFFAGAVVRGAGDVGGGREAGENAAGAGAGRDIGVIGPAEAGRDIGGLAGGTFCAGGIGGMFGMYGDAA